MVAVTGREIGHLASDSYCEDFRIDHCSAVLWIGARTHILIYLELNLEQYQEPERNKTFLELDLCYNYVYSSISALFNAYMYSYMILAWSDPEPYNNCTFIGW